ncbi:MAG TPA: redoxin domain-containing protein [Myxococcota bacterium]|jgi:peroxiredoxin|nr:redoxin domain-containing protein [Myxococcota bacterium]
MIQKGDVAPDFELQGNDDAQYSLAKYKGKNVVLAFYPLDFSPVCTNEHTCFVNDLAQFNAADAVVLGISVDSRWAHKAFAAKLGITYPLLADFHPKGAVGAKYGVYDESKGLDKRVTVVIGKDGKVVSAVDHGIPNVPSTADILAAVKGA